MVVTLTGENGFALQQALRQLVDGFVAEHGDLAVERIDGQEADINRLRAGLSELPFLAAKKLVILRSPGSQKMFLENFEELLTDLPETTDVIIVEPKLDKRLSYYKYLKKQTDFREFPEPDSAGLSRWLVETAKERSGMLGPTDARYLIDRVGANQQLLANELEKLLLHNPKIDRQSIDNLTEPTPQSSIFQLLEAAFAGRTQRALKLYAEQRAQKVEPQQIIAMLSWQLHVLAIIQTAGDRPADQIAREAKLNPFVVSKSQGIARKLELPRLRRLINDLLTIDLKLKSTSIDPDEALQHYLLNMTM